MPCLVSCFRCLQFTQSTAMVTTTISSQLSCGTIQMFTIASFQWCVILQHPFLSKIRLYSSGQLKLSLDQKKTFSVMCVWHLFWRTTLQIFINCSMCVTTVTKPLWETLLVSYFCCKSSDNISLVQNNWLYVMVTSGHWCMTGDRTVIKTKFYSDL